MALFSKRSREGYLLIDHRASPGLSEQDARFNGFDPAHCGEGKIFEAATLTCSHCKCGVVKNPLRTRERPHCFKCNHYICDVCEARTHEPFYSHAPYEKLVEDNLKRQVILTP